MSYCLFCLRFRCSNRVIVDCVLNFVAMATRVSRGRICLTSFNSTIRRSRKTPTRRKHLSDISHTRWVISSQISLPWQPGSVAVECVTSFNSPTPKTRVGRKDLLDISYTSQIIADFVSNFVAVATWIGPFKISLTSLDSLIPKTPC